MELAGLNCCRNTTFLKDLEIMKKLLFILTLFISVSSFAQTKEETIEWLNTYSGDFLQSQSDGVKYMFSVGVDISGKISVDLNMSKNDGYSSKIIYMFDAKDITRIKLDDKPNESNGLYYLMVITQKDAIKEVNKTGNSRQSNYFSIYVNSYEDLNRVYKALARYASFFGYKEKVAKETF